jgi:hypothetical protein
MFRSRRFLLWLLPVLLFVGVCFPLVDVLDGPDQLGARGDFTAEEHLHSSANHGCLAAESGRGARRKAPALVARVAKRSAKSVPAARPSIRSGDPSANEAVVILERSWPFLRRSAPAPRAPDRLV